MEKPYLERVAKVEVEMDRLSEAMDEFRENYSEKGNYSGHVAKIRRASMDLTKVLVDLRRPIGEVF